MAISTIYPNGVNEVVVPATQSIAISNFGGGIASIYYLIVTANYPPAYQLQQTLNNSSVVLGAFADGMTIKIEAGSSTVRYDVGASPDTGIGDADTLGGNPPSYYAVDSEVVHLSGTETVTGAKTFSSSLTMGNFINMPNNTAVRFQEVGGSYRASVYISASDVLTLGTAALPTDIKSNGTLTYNAASLASGTFTTADAKTVTVVDGFITSIV